MSENHNTDDEFSKEATALRDMAETSADKLREHCDSVAIICTLSEGPSSQMAFAFKGNVFAVKGSVDRFMEKLCMILDCEDDI